MSQIEAQAMEFKRTALPKTVSRSAVSKEIDSVLSQISLRRVAWYYVRTYKFFIMTVLAIVGWMCWLLPFWPSLVIGLIK